MNKVHIRAWSSDDGWWIGSDERLRFTKEFKNYGMLAKLTFLYSRIFYQNVLVEIEQQLKGLNSNEESEDQA